MNISDEQLQQLVDRTVKWANELSEVWTHTTTGRIIDSQLDLVHNMVKTGNKDLMYVAASELKETLQNVEKTNYGH